jgi:hypothetical protein
MAGMAMALRRRLLLIGRQTTLRGSNKFFAVSEIARESEQRADIGEMLFKC